MSLEEGNFSEILRNKHFLLLWTAQAISQSAQNGIGFVQMVLVEKLTGSTGHMALVILAFSLPGVLFSSLAGIVVDRFSYKTILVASNAVRVVVVSAFILCLHTMQGFYLLLVLYFLAFASSTVGQFFSPAEVATIPLLVGEKRLLTANALFNLTYIGTQVAGLIVLAPLAVKLLGVENSFAAIAVMYFVATILVSFLPKDAPKLISNFQGSTLRRIWQEVKEGWRFVASQKAIYTAIAKLALVTTLLMTMAMLAPGFATRVLHMSPEDVVFVFAPAGVGMLLTAVLIGRFGHHFRREAISNVGLMGLGLTLVAFTPVAARMVFPEIIPPVMAISFLSLFIGTSMAMITIPAQTMIQENSPMEIRGRVIAVYFMMSNLAAIPPMLFIGAVADKVGILPVISVLALGVLAIAILNARRASLHPSDRATKSYP